MKATETLNVIIYFQDRILDTTHIEVYDCKTLANDCSTCEYYRKIDNYLCSWCNHCQYSTKCPNNQECPAPKITNVFPENSTLGGNTEVILEGTNFGVNSSDVTKLSLAGINCIEVIKRKNQFQKLWCKTGPSYKEHTGPVTITVNGRHNSYGQFSYKDQVLKAIKPSTIIKEGGVWLTISGTNLNVGNKKYVVFLNSTNDMEGVHCENALLSVDDSITCSVDSYPSKFDRFEHQINLDKLIVMFDGNTTKELAMNFSFVSNPYDIRLSAIKSFSSGGRKLTVTGSNLRYVIQASFDNEQCLKRDADFICTTPRLTEKNIKQKQVNVEERSIVLQLDGLQKKFLITYVPDPTIYELQEDKEYDSNSPWYLTIKGENLNQAANLEDYNVTIGKTLCEVSVLSATYLHCIPQRDKLSEAERYLVKVSVGNLSKDVGYVKQVTAINTFLILSIVLSVIIVVLAIVFVVIIIICRKRKTK